MSKTKSYFITATGTDIGKTFYMCSLIRQFIAKDGKVNAIKPIISGYSKDDENSDTHKIIDALGIDNTENNINKISPWRFKYPLSPDMAAEKEGRIIDYHEVLDFCKSNLLPNTINLVEGVGGVMVPINNDKLIVDLIVDLDIEVILVTGTYLGSLNHTLTSIETLKNRGVVVRSLIVNESAGDNVGLVQTINSLQKFYKGNIIPIKRAGE